jgi:hypothetical protein
MTAAGRDGSGEGDRILLIRFQNFQSLGVMANMSRITVIVGTLLGWLGVESKVPALAENEQNVISQMRENVFNLDPATIGISRSNYSGQVWGMLFETGTERGAYSLVVLADGTTSLYFSTGGGIIGAGEHSSVRIVSKNLLLKANDAIDHSTLATTHPLSYDGISIFYFLTFEGTCSYSASESKLGNGQDSLSTLFHSSHEVISELRTINSN